ncbi:MAG TPA: histidine phosphatase family protein [Gemmatimonadaceae bacterium]|jgi:probable phosphoglycerate mutase
MRLYLVRHALCDGVGSILRGRAPGVSLNDEGREQAVWLADRLRDERVHAIYSSPLDRARETAETIAAPHRLPVCIEPALNEIDFGEWTGRTISDLQEHPRWRAFNERRGATRVPGGELMLEVQQRMIAAVDSLRERHPWGTVIAVSHSDVIKAALAHYLRISLDHILCFEIDPASISTLDVERSRTRVIRLNDSVSSDSFSPFRHHKP